jgi:hypothetical protein
MTGFSALAVGDESFAAFEAVKEGDLRWATFSIDNKMDEIVLDQTADRSAPFESLLDTLRDAKNTVSGSQRLCRGHDDRRSRDNTRRALRGGGSRLRR